MCTRRSVQGRSRTTITHDVRGRGEKSSRLENTSTRTRTRYYNTPISHHNAGMVSRESSRPRSRGVYHYPLQRALLTPPLVPSLDSFVAVVTSTPPFPPYSTFSPNDFYSFSHSQRVVDPSTGFFPTDPLFTEPLGASGVKEDVWLGGTAQSTSPSSPFTYVCSHLLWLTRRSIDSQTDSQAGGDYHPPATESNPSDSPSAEQHRRGFPNLNIALPPTGLQLGQGVSPASLVSSGAAFTTDSLSMNVDAAEDYFRFADAALPGDSAEALNASVSLPQSTRPTPSPLGGGAAGPMVGGMLPAQTTHYRLPASQPSSPVRGVFMSGQQQFPLSPTTGRQRSTTVSGISPFDPTFGVMAGFGGPLQLPQMNGGGALSAPVTALPHHLAFTAIHSPVATPVGGPTSTVASVAASPVTERPPNAYLGGEPNHAASAQTGTVGDVTMEDATNPSSRRSSGASSQSTAGLTGQGGSVASTVPSASGSAVAAGVAPQLSTNDIAERLTMEKLTMLD